MLSKAVERVSASFCPSKSFTGTGQFERMASRGVGSAYNLPLGDLPDLVEQFFSHGSKLELAVRNGVVRNESKTREVLGQSLRSGRASMESVRMW